MNGYFRCSVRVPLWLLAGCLLVSPLSAADHRDAPALLDSAVVGPADINDLYAFQSPTNADQTVFIMTVNPLAGVLSPTQFDDQIVYEFRVDKEGAALADIIYQYRFLSFLRQNIVIVSRVDPSSFFGSRGLGQILGIGLHGHDIPLIGGGSTRVGLFDDPFFFDLNGFTNGFQFTGDDFFAGANVSAIVLEVPSGSLTGDSPNISVWARTVSRLGFLHGTGDQIDRMGRPAINTVLIPTDLKDTFNVSLPVDDQANFRDVVVATIESLTGGDTATANALADILLPDVLTVDVSNPAGFLNGRQPADDVIDAELNLLSNGALTTDLVDANDLPFLGIFPYLAPPH